VKERRAEECKEKKVFATAEECLDFPSPSCNIKPLMHLKDQAKPDSESRRAGHGRKKDATDGEPIM
jgi:hypothetical protein